MKRINTQIGGRPIKNDDLVILEQPLNIIEQTYQAANYPDFIVSGCEITGTGPFDIAAGLIYVNGKIRTFAGATSAASLPLDLVEDDNDINNRTYFDSVSKATATELRLIAGTPADFSISTSSLRAVDLLKLTTKKIINIGDWDMLNTASITVAHGVTDFKKIRRVSVTIRNDADTIYADFIDKSDSAVMVGGPVTWDATNIILKRLFPGNYGNGSYTATSYNRGFIMIEYID